MKLPTLFSAFAAKLPKNFGSLGLKGLAVSRGFLLVGSLVVLLGAMAAAQSWHLVNPTNSTPQQTADQEQPPKDSPAPSDTQADTAPADNKQPAATNAQPTQQAPSSPKTLKVTPDSFTVKPGENLQLTIQAGDGKAINYPFFATSTNGNFLFNFAAAPAKTSWSGPILVSQTTPLGTYTLDITAQTSSAVTYRGKITVNVVKPTMNIAIQSLGYDAENDALTYLVKINRLYGFSEPVTEVAAYSAGAPGFVCYYTQADADTIALACGHDEAEGDRPTSGTLTVEISTNTLTKSASTPYTLPPISQ